MFGIPLVFTDVAINVLITWGFPLVETVLRGICIASFAGMVKPFKCYALPRITAML